MNNNRSRETPHGGSHGEKSPKMVTVSKKKLAEIKREFDIAVREKRVLERKANTLAHTLKGKEKEWTATEKELQIKLARISQSVNRHWSQPSQGRNKLKKSDYDGYDHSNAANISKWLKFDFMPHYKFWHPGWKKYRPENPNSFFRKLIPELDVPDDEEVSLYWSHHLVGMVNKKVVEWRSNVSARIMAQYKGENLFVIILLHGVTIPFPKIFICAFEKLM